MITQVRHLDTTDKSELHKLQLLKDELGEHNWPYFLRRFIF